LTAKENDAFLQKVFIFQLATGEIERSVYKKLIAPFKDDLPASDMEGFERVCADHKYAYLTAETDFSYLSLSCQPVPLPGTSYREQGGFIISKNSSYKGLINWR